jgi:hypothetical protein
VDPATLVLEDASPAEGHEPAFEDVDRDGRFDLVAGFRTAEADLERDASGLPAGCLSWQSLGGVPYESCDPPQVASGLTVRVSWSCGLGFELALVLPPLMAWRARRRGRAGRAAG